MKNNMIILILVLAGIAACRSPRNPYTNADITADEIRYDIQFLASDSLKGRLPGTPGIEMAAEYIADRFQDFGLIPKGTDGYRQPFEVITGLSTGDSCVLSMDGRDYEVAKDFVPLASSADAAAEADVVFAGYGMTAQDLQYDDYQGVDVKGRIVLILRFSPEGDNPHGGFYKYTPLRRKVALAAEMGARGVLVVTGPEDDDDELVSLEYDNTISNYGIPAASISRAAAAGILKMNAADLQTLQKKINASRKPASFATPSRVKLTCRIVVQRQQTANIIGYLEGSDPDLKKQVLVIGGHYDHLGMGGSNSMYRGAPAIHNGADDNASGTTAVMELAQKLASERSRLKRSVLFIAFSGEEMGTLGSRYFLEHPTVDSAAMTTMLNFDMVGRLRDSRIVIQGMGTSPKFAEVVKTANEPYHLNAELLPDGNGPSDFAEFYRKNIPIISFFTDLHEDYHKPSDDADKINVAGEDTILHLAHDIILTLAADSVRPEFTKVKGDSAKTPTGFRATLGLVPSYTSAEDGLKVDDVNPGEAADKAGIRKGDVITKFGRRTIHNVYDYTYALGDYKAGDKVDVVVRREGKEVTVQAVLQKSRRRK